MDTELLYKAFNASPDAILISRLIDGRFIEVNHGFSRLSGYSREEALSSSSIQIGIWKNLSDRENVVATLQKDYRVHDYEADFRTKDGNIITCLVSGEIIELNGDMHVLWVVRDITERKQVDSILQLRLKLWEFAGAHTLNELMQTALDEIEALTGSLISFYHFVERDQNTISLQAWSTRTLAEFCEAQGAGLHYPIQEAGVWVDCVHQRQPVIHNHYASLPHRKGLPEGHAEVIRELVAPTMREGRVVAILGVGNKPVDYDRQDIELVSYISDLVWEIVERKRADEQIRQLNTQLEHLAMTDELTGLTNRRSFFIKSDHEIKRTKRYHSPLSLLMLDVDGFKDVNDKYGHEVGDLVLQCVAHTLLENVREIDTVARMGGEEFCVLLPNTKATEAFVLAERLRQAIEKIRYPVRDQTMHVTASIGVASYHKDIMDIDGMLRNADKAMYQAKKEGRNRVAFLA